CSTRIASARSRGGPQTPWPVSRMAPKPMRLTVRSPPKLRVAAAAAGVALDRAAVMSLLQDDEDPLGGCAIAVPRFCGRLDRRAGIRCDIHHSICPGRPK